MIMPSARRWARVALATCCLAGLAVACGSEEGPPGAPPEVAFDSGPTLTADSGYMVPVGSPCTEATMKPCKVLLPSHGSVHPCFVGVQICTDGKWGACVERPEAGPAGDGGAVN